MTPSLTSRPHPRSGWRRAVVVSLVAIIGVCLGAGCSDAVSDQEEAEKIVVPGSYRAVYDFHTDDCEPSLREISDRVEGWPQDPVPVQAQLTGDSQEVWFIFWVTALRHGHGYNHWSLYDADRRVKDPDLESFVTPEQDFSHTKCSGLYGFAPERMEVDPYLADTGRIVIDVTTEWGEPYDCPDDEHSHGGFIPKQACVEAYRVEYILDEPCLPVEYCRVNAGALPFGTGPDGFRFNRQRTDCECEEPPEGWELEEP